MSNQQSKRPTLANQQHTSNQQSKRHTLANQLSMPKTLQSLPQRFITAQLLKLLTSATNHQLPIMPGKQTDAKIE
jgi:hypothetical protein